MPNKNSKLETKSKVKKKNKNKTENISLIGKCLISSPGMTDDRFDKSIVYICANSKEGSMGIVINRPIFPVKFAELLKQLDINISSNEVIVSPDIVYGGPVESSRGFVLHSADYFLASTVIVKDNIAITATLDILEAIAKGKGPSQSMIALGYAGWTSGQLEEELKNNNWLITDADEELIFKTPHNQKWKKALAKIGVDPNFLLSGQGNA